MRESAIGIAPATTVRDNPEDASARPLRVAFVNTHPIQYFAPLYAHLTRTGLFDVTALYLSDFSIRGGLDKGFGRSVVWDLDLLAGYKSKFIGNAAGRRRIGGFFSMVAPELWDAILNGGFDAVVINGHNLAAHHLALAASRSAGILVFTRGETHPRLRRSGWRETVRTPLLKAWYRAFDGCLAIGSANKRYYQLMDVPTDKIAVMPYTVDNERYMAAARQAPVARAATRARLGITSASPAILYAAKFDRRKRPDDLIRAYAMLRAEGISTELVMVGSGVLDDELKSMVRELGLEGVSFPGFINQTELPAVYGACDIFVLPSENEPWGLAINEAMCAALPIVLSEEIGCVEDLVAHGVNGATYKAGDVRALAAALRPLLVDPVHRAHAGQASFARISKWSYAECAVSLEQAITAARERRGISQI